MTIIVFLIDTSASMLQRTYMGTTYLDYARLAVEQFLKLRQRDPASNGDRYMLLTFEEYPYNIKSGWKENQRILNEQLKNLRAKGSYNFESGLESVFRLITVSRMQSGSGAAIETYGFGRYPSYAEHVVIIPIIDGSSLPPYKADARIPKPQLLNGTELCLDAFRWDQRLYPIVLRLPGQLQTNLVQQGISSPSEDNSIAQSFAEQMGGRSFTINLHRSLGPSIEQIIQRVQTNGVLIRFQKFGPNPPLPEITENEQSNEAKEDDLSWANSLVLLKGKMGQTHSHWPIPEAYWPDSVKSTLPPRTAHPVIAFKCEQVDPLFNTDFPLDKYELESTSSLAQYILGRKDQNLCWQVFVENSYKQPGLGFPFGYIKISTSSTVTLYVMPYNYPELLTLLAHAKDPKETATAQFQQKFDKYLKTVPGYYNSALKKALSRIKVLPPSLKDANTKLYGYCNLGALQTRIKHQGQQEFETACVTVHKTLIEPTISNPALIVKVSRSRTQLNKSALTECTFRPAVAAFKANIPADAFKESSIFLLEAPPQNAIPSFQFKNPFDIARTNLCSQLDKMRLNFDQQVQTNNLHVLEGGMPGQIIKLQHAEDLHNLPINKMGSYEEYMKSMNAIGLGPKRELEPQAARPHAFGNPFKLDKKNMSIVDEVGEENTAAEGAYSSNQTEGQINTNGNGANGNTRGGGERREKKRGERAASEGPSTMPTRPKRKQGPLDVNTLAGWKRRRRAASIGGGFDDTSSIISSDFDDFQSAPELGDNRLAELDEEEDLPEEGEQQYPGIEIGQEEDIMGQNGAEIAEKISKILHHNPIYNRHLIVEDEQIQSSSSTTNHQNNIENRPIPLMATATATDSIISLPGTILGNNDGGGRVDVGAQGQEEMVAPSTSKKPSAISNKSAKPVDKKQEAAMMKRTIKQRRQIPAIPNNELLARQHLICQLIRNISLRTDELHNKIMEVITERPLSRENRRKLWELAEREANQFKRQKLADMVGTELARTTTASSMKMSNGPGRPSASSDHNHSNQSSQQKSFPPFLKQNGFGI